FTFNYSAIGKKLVAKLDSEYIVADYFVNGKSSIINGKLTKGSNTQQITFPYKQKLDPNAEQYEFNVDGLSASVFDDTSNPSLYVVGYRTTDSVFIQTINPHGLEMTYSIFKGKKEIEKGTSKNVHLTAKDDSKDAYFVTYYYTWLGHQTQRTNGIQVYNKALDVSIEPPREIYPGQKTKVKIKVTDYKKRPLENVNITAYAINSQFEKNNNPYFPYSGKLFRKTGNTDSYELDQENKEEGDLLLSIPWRNRMHLDTMPYYKMLYPANGIHYNYDSAQTINAEFAPFLFDKGKRVPVYIVYIDNNPVYYYNTDNAAEYAFMASYGYHKIKIRTLDKDYLVDSVLFKQRTKLDLAMDVNNLPKNVTVVQKNNRLTDEERISVKNSVISIYDYPGAINYLWQDNKAIVLFRDKYQNTYPTLHRFGGFFPKNMNFAVQNDFYQSFLFEPGYDYIIKNGVVKLTANSFFYTEVALSPNQNSYPAMGLRVTSVNNIKLKTPLNWFKDFATYNVNSTTEGNGTYKYEYTGDSSICLIRVQNYGNDSLTHFYYGFGNNVFYNLQPGLYNVTFITFNKYYIKKDSVTILPDGTLFQRFGDTSFEKGIFSDKKDTMAHTTAKNNWQTPQEVSLFDTYTYDNIKDGGAIKVVLTDKKTKESIPFANVVVYNGKTQIAVGTTDMDGNVTIRPLPPGRYNVKAVYVGYQPSQINDVPVRKNNTSYVNIALSNGGVELSEVMVCEYSAPLIDADSRSGSVVIRETFQAMAAKDVNSVISTQAGVILTDNGENIQVRGNRSGNTSVFIDGERAIGVTGEQVAAKEVRTNFSDCGYWQPNLITD
ncbi:MAG TPA: carboxypeptidase regulatory-like domain-containing protein, partial [Bacteroidia bacterium]|nr:carboxypeptidase regulatory-like domain-containing protein [Bacteroidia bacterium]